MKLKNKSENYKELNLIKFLFLLWKEKFIILSIFLIVLSSAYFYINLNSGEKKFYKSSIILKSNNQSFIEIENKFMIDDYYDAPKSKYFIDGSQNPINLLNLLYINFLENITSADNLKLFFDQNNNINDFKLYLKKNGIKVKDYFSINFKSNENDLKNIFTLYFPSELDGEKFLNEYIQFMYSKTKNLYKNYQLNNINNKISSYSKSLEIAREIGLINPILQSIPESSAIVNINDPNILFYKGSKVLNIQLKHLEVIKDRVKKSNLTFKPILVLATDRQEILKDNFRIYLNAILLSLLISLSVILIKNINLKDKF